MASKRPAVAKIQEYGFIGDCRAAALVSRYGSIDALCWPRFDSPSIFAALLDPEKGGYWSIAPTMAFHTERAYIHDTNVLETIFDLCFRTSGAYRFNACCIGGIQAAEPRPRPRAYKAVAL